MASPAPVDDGLATLHVDAARSTLRVSARSNVGPIEFTSTELTGAVHARFDGGTVDLTKPTAAMLVVSVASLSSGNTLYDAEVRQRLHAQRYPSIRATLQSATELSAGRFALEGSLTIHGATRPLAGTVQLTVTEGPRLFVEGEQMVDMRDFDIRLPNALMLRIYPDVLVRFRFEAVA